MRPKEKILGKYLMIKGKYLTDLLKGNKTTTIRLGIVVPKFKEIIIHSKGIPIAYAEIVGIKHKKISELSDREVKEDGFKNKEELIRELESIYGHKIRRNEWVTIIKLRIKERIKDLPPWYKSNYDPVLIARKALEHINDLCLSKEEVKILETIIKTGSIRKAAFELFGSVYKRKIIRGIIRKVFERLRERGIIP